MPGYDKIFGYQDPIMVSIPENSSPVEHETHKGDSIFQILQDVFGLIGEDVDMDIDRRSYIEGNEEGSSEQCVEVGSKHLGGAPKNMEIVQLEIQAPNPTLWYEPLTRGNEDNYAAQRARCIYLVAEIFAFNIGFPLDLTQLMAEERGLTVNVKGFNAAMDEARERSRSAQTKQAGGTIAMDANVTASLHKMGVPTTNDHRKFIWFQDHESTIKAIYCGTEFLESAEVGKEMGVVLESMSFYAEQGGQGGFILDMGVHMIAGLRMVSKYSSDGQCTTSFYPFSGVTDELKAFIHDISEISLKKVVKVACEKAEAAVSDEKGFYISCVDVGLDATIVREAVLKGISAMIFNVDETTNKVVVYDGVPDKGNTSQVDSSANAFIWE
ncbi:hypothetical protein Ancab_001283 [Ancistrocladus abbreviatus]